jgi:hypothetical protein
MRMKTLSAGIALLAALAGCAGAPPQGQGAVDGPAIVQSTLIAGTFPIAPAAATP